MNANILSSSCTLTPFPPFPVSPFPRFLNNTNVLAPKWLLSGHKQDGFPAYEIYVRDSDGSSGDEKGTPVYQYDPIPLGRTPEDLFPAPVGADETVLPANGTIP